MTFFFYTFDLVEELDYQAGISDVLKFFQNQLFDISSRNPFINVRPESLWLLDYSDTANAAAKRIHSKQVFFLKEYGLETTLKIAVFLQWQLPTNKRFYCSPLLYKAATVKRHQKIDLQYTVTENEEDAWLVNPVIVHLFKLHFNYEFKASYASTEVVYEDLKSYFNTSNHKLKEVESFTTNDEWQLIKQSAVGTFNYKKSSLANDFETIIERPNTLIERFLGYQHFQNEPRNNQNLDWYPLDSSQKNVVSFASANNVLIQGPPGTGKSHTIVALLQHYLEIGKTVLFVSEKKSALDTVYKRLNTLRPFTAYFDAEKNPKLSYYKSLKQAFEKAQHKEIKKDIDFNQSALAINNIYPKELQKKNGSSISLAELEEMLLANDDSIVDVNQETVIPDYETWQKYVDELTEIEGYAKQEWQVSTIGESAFLVLNKAVLKEVNPIAKIDKKIAQLISSLELVKQIQHDYQFEFNWDDYSKLCLSASILNMVNQSQIDLLFEDTKAFKSFNTWAKKYQLTKNQINAIQLKNSAWKNRPTVSELENHLRLLKRKGLFSKIQVLKSHKRIFLNYNQPLKIDEGEAVINSLLEEIVLETKLNEVAIKLKHNLNILNPDTDIDFILNIRKKTQNITHNYYQHILEHEAHEELINLLTEQHQTINNVNRVKAYLFSQELPQEIDQLLIYLYRLKQELNKVNHSVDELVFLLNLPYNLLFFIRLNPFTCRQLSKVILINEREKMLKFQPYIKQLNGQILRKDVTNFNDSKKRTHQSIIQSIQHKIVDKWQSAEDIMATPNAKLSDNLRVKKSELKKAKRVAIHEMNKSRQLLPVKSLFKEAGQLVTTIQPIWMMNPLAISERLPLDADLFDVVIFDESSQIPVEDALPAIYRAKQVVVVGDSKQMPPNQFFTGRKDVVTLLSQAERVLPIKSLMWHYRSEHPDLIRFSNQQFYDNELKLFPPINNYMPIEGHYIANGVFENSVNVIEAQAIAHHLKELLTKGHKDIAIIALSKEQEKCIRQYIAKDLVDVPTSVLIRNLESVQGIEKKFVIISVGYAKNNEGKLSHNFGPINQEQGANRLNVLFSRAIKKMDIYMSIKPADIGLSHNRGLMILSQFLEYAERVNAINSRVPSAALEVKIASHLNDQGLKYYYYSHKTGMIVSAFVDEKHQKVLLVNPGLYSTEDSDLSAVLQVLQQRFAHVKIVLNADWIADSVRLKKDVTAYFS
ncbi:MAG: AAA domain-containing protein [Putridiphycobacter sp.]|nr:AAA domain-containing protein [Putridiphycobacter sp.]